MAVETAEQRAAELAELRRLTPEQEAAAAKAAQRIEEVAAAADRLRPQVRVHRDWTVSTGHTVPGFFTSYSGGGGYYWHGAQSRRE